jgi:2-amino-4-hydroxy-6-hydroxymethyldihydropteridine diphosphokinase
MTNRNIALIGIGSNIDPEHNIKAMMELLEKAVKVIRVSSFIKTRPVGIADQPDFTNGAVMAETHLKQDELIKILKEIEDRLGRDRSAPKSGPRTIDLDLIVWNGRIIDSDYYNREFVRRSINEISEKL